MLIKYIGCKNIYFKFISKYAYILEYFASVGQETNSITSFAMPGSGLKRFFGAFCYSFDYRQMAHVDGLCLDNLCIAANEAFIYMLCI